MNIDYWIQVLRQDPEAIHSFHQYLQKYTSESSLQFKTVKSMDKVCKLQGHLELLERIYNDFNYEPEKESANDRAQSKSPRA